MEIGTLHFHCPNLEDGGRFLAWLPLAGSMCIALGYAVIVSHILKAFVDSVSGTLMTADTSSWFEGVSMTGYSVIPFHAIVVVGTLLTLLLGASSSEKSNKVMMPLFFVIFVILAVRVSLLPGAGPSLLFVTLPRILQDIPLGRLFAIILYLAMIFAGRT